MCFLLTRRYENNRFQNLVVTYWSWSWLRPFSLCGDVTWSDLCSCVNKVYSSSLFRFTKDTLMIHEIQIMHGWKLSHVISTMNQEKSLVNSNWGYFFLLTILSQKLICYLQISWPSNVTTTTVIRIFFPNFNVYINFYHFLDFSFKWFYLSLLSFNEMMQFILFYRHDAHWVDNSHLKKVLIIKNSSFWQLFNSKRVKKDQFWLTENFEFLSVREFGVAKVDLNSWPSGLGVELRIERSFRKASSGKNC